MRNNLRTKTSDEMIHAIFSLDLDPIKFKLMDKKEGHGWTRAQADSCEQEYKRFLALLARYPDETIAPDTTVDKFWHAHILDTMKYAEDCNAVFGYFLHHFPYFGMRGEDDAAKLDAAAINLRRLYDREFGAAERADAAYCGASATSYCGATVSYCGAAVTSYCGAAKNNPAGKVQAQVAYCGEAGKFDTRTRPVLPKRGVDAIAV